MSMEECILIDPDGIAWLQTVSERGRVVSRFLGSLNRETLTAWAPTKILPAYDMDTPKRHRREWDMLLKLARRGGRMFLPVSFAPMHVFRACVELHRATAAPSRLVFVAANNDAPTHRRICWRRRASTSFQAAPSFGFV